jgi:hypothetical protein
MTPSWPAPLVRWASEACIASIFQQPLCALFSHVACGDSTTAVLVATSGGLTGSDAIP